MKTIIDGKKRRAKTFLAQIKEKTDVISYKDVNIKTQGEDRHAWKLIP